MALPILETADELYAQSGTPCATCTCSYMTLRSGAGTAAGFDMGAGLTLRVCRVGLDPVVADEGTDKLWCDHFAPFSERIPIPPDELEQLQQECSRGFLGDLAQGRRPLPRHNNDLRWYDRGLREGWLPPHGIEEDRDADGERLRGPWEQFRVVGVTPRFGDGHTPARGRAVLQAKDRRTYLLAPLPSAAEVTGTPQPHTWWVSQVAGGAALPLESPVTAKQDHVMLVLRGGEQVLSAHAYRYLPAEAVAAHLQSMAEEALGAARAALRHGDQVVAELCARRGLRARPDHPGLRELLESL